MKLADLQYLPHFDLLAPHALFRVQRSRARSGSLRVGRLILPPAHLMAGRFDLCDVPVGYFAESPETAIYESLCRREATGLSLSLVVQRSLLCLQTSSTLRLLDLRPHAQSWPVLQSLRFSHTQALAAEAHAQGFVGIVYRSAQQSGMDCFVLFGPALDGLRLVRSESLIEREQGCLHRVMAAALQGSQVPLTP